ncbi:MAG: HEAT repeat domain-containing protein [Chloroflexota bacterium]
MAIDYVAELIEALSSNNRDRRGLARQQLVAIGPSVVDMLIPLVAADDGWAAVEAAHILGELSDLRAYPVLVNAIRSRNPLLAGRAVQSVLNYTGQDLASDLLAVLPHAHVITQQAILNALRRLNDPATVPYLLEQLQRTTSPLIRCVIIQTLGKVGDATLIPRLTDFMWDDDHHVRDWAVEVIKQLEMRG